MLSEQIDTVQHRVVQRRPAPRLEACQYLHPLGWVGLPKGEGKDVVVEGEHRHKIIRGNRAEELSGSRLQERERRLYAVADVEGDHQFERYIFGNEARDMLRSILLEHMKGTLIEAGDKTAIVGHRDRYLDR